MENSIKSILLKFIIVPTNVFNFIILNLYIYIFFFDSFSVLSKCYLRFFN